MAENAMKIAQEYPQRYRYQYLKAAETLRSPYWDWAANTDVPTPTIPDKIRVNVPRGQHLEQIEVDNPLLTFKFPEAALQGVYGDFDNRTKMYRCESPESYPESANALTAARPYKQMVVSDDSNSKNRRLGNSATHPREVV
jgi:tyrosinase